MIELGPVQWAFPADTADSPAHGGDWPGTGPAPRLHITDTENPGFVLLLQEKRATCRHSERLAFRAEHVTQLLTDYLRLTAGEAVTRRAINGPACSYSTTSDTAFHVTEYDDVPCLRIPVWWFSDEFFTRQRRYGWPPQAVLDDIRQFGLHLVPVGAPGSRSQQIEWRLSFSRAELAVVSVMTDIQRFVVIAFKVCKAALGTDAKVIKSYYAKTAAMWLYEQTPAHEWDECHERLAETAGLPR
ncbi:hypothetical protein FJT64_018230 [Amphibalanus amphitrite]|uniref:Mab-21-like nucleotidyltransferase domain-containing protein n=1 Tax=Amphibalanus amphitrite TaxID=1232801 RepID=A0A6A4X4A0_AMPAM|nr:hypothetical protein FJT64_018230 [Amphibalanus amphitrite]